MSRRGSDAERSEWHDRASLMTPLAKAFSTDAAIEVASLGIQVHGGAGYIEQTGAAQHLRDARIFAIYEGTNGIQAIDLVLRKLKLAGGIIMKRHIDDLAAIAADVAGSNRAGFGTMAARLASAVDDVGAATEHMVATLSAGRSREALAGATPFLRLVAITTAAGLLAKGALRADADKSERQVAIARYFVETIAVESPALRANVIEAGVVHATGVTSILAESAVR